MLPLEAPADESRLLLACERLRARRLDPSRPLWEMWFLPGLPDGRPCSVARPKMRRFGCGRVPGVV